LSPKPPYTPYLEVVRVALVGIGFPFKDDIAVSLIPIAIAYQLEKKIKEIPNGKEEYQGLYLLSQVDTFVVDKLFIVLITFITNEDERI
jgi:hypothetical protein